MKLPKTGNIIQANDDGNKYLVIRLARNYENPELLDIMTALYPFEEHDYKSSFIVVDPSDYENEFTLIVESYKEKHT